MSWLTRNWQRLNSNTIGTQRYWSIALQNASIFATTAPLAARYIHGRTLDLGAGKLAWRRLLRRYSSTYISSDLTREHDDIDILFDVTKPFPFACNTFDSIFCHSVLEHTKEPWLVFEEIERVLAEGGTGIISAPFVFYLHGQPYDYYRFTRYGLPYLAERAGLEVVESASDGSIVHLLLNIPSILMSTALSAVGLSRLVLISTRFWLVLAKSLSVALGSSDLFALNNLIVVRKPRQTTA